MITFQESPDLALFRRRLAETIAWCAPRASGSDPTYSLRSPALDPKQPLWKRPEAVRPEIVARLAEKRATLLLAEQAQPCAPSDDRAGGRLLAYCPDWSLHYGIGESQTGGFLDREDAPGWDTWIWLFQASAEYDPTGHLKPVVDSRGVPMTHTCVLCWIPPCFLGPVDEAILADGAGGFFWASDYRNGLDMEFMRELDSAGVLT